MFIFQDCREGSQFTESGDTMIFKFEAQAPKIDEKAYAFNTATLIGKVELKEDVVEVEDDAKEEK